MNRFLKRGIVLGLSVIMLTSNASALNLKNKELITTDVSLSDKDYKSLGYKINPLWEEYNSLSDEDKAAWEVIPSKYILDYKYKKPSIFKNYGTLNKATYEEKFDLRDVNGNSYITPNKNQDTLGLCWAFSSNASVESNILINNLRNSLNPALLSERQLDYISTYPVNNKTLTGVDSVQVIEEGFNPYAIKYNGEYFRELGDGGNFSVAAMYYGLGYSPVISSGKWETYNTRMDTVKLSDVFDLSKVEYSVTDYAILPSIDGIYGDSTVMEAYRDLVKGYVKEYGALTVGTLAPQASTSAACYVKDATNNVDLVNWNEACSLDGTVKYEGTHQMNIIGWDDTYQVNYCANPQTGVTSSQVDKETCENGGGTYYNVNGAWILKNSWGNNVSYPYLAYSSYFTEVGAVTRTIERDYDYSYNTLGPIYQSESNDNSTTEVFYKVAGSKEKLKRVSFEVYGMEETEYTVLLIDESTGDDVEFLGTVSTNMPGRYSLDVDNYSLDGDYYVIVVVPNNPNYQYKAFNVYAFTKTDSKEVKVNTQIMLNYDLDSNGNYIYPVQTRGINIATGSNMTYELYTNSGELIDGVFSKSYSINGANNTEFTTYGELLDPLYTLKTYANGVLVGSNTFATYIDLNGEGTEDYPFEITKASDLAYLVTDDFKSNYFMLANDVDLDELVQNPLGIGNNIAFSGTLDGNGYSFNNMKQNTDKVGLFYKVNGAIKNVKFDNVNLISQNGGGAIGYIADGAYIENVSVTGNIKSTSGYTGALFGSIINSDMSEVYSYTLIDGGTSGHFAGYMETSEVLNSFNTGTIKNANVGITSFVGEISNSSLQGLIDYGKIINSNKVNSENTSTSNNIYYVEGEIEFIGTKLSIDELHNTSNFNLNETYWTFDNGYPMLKNNGIIFIKNFESELESNIFVGNSVNIEISIDPENATYKDYELYTNDSNIVSINGKTINAISGGNATIYIKSLDGFNVSKEINVHVFSEEFKEKMYNPTTLKLKEKSDVLSSYIPTEAGLTIEMPNKDYFGTGDVIIYKLGDKEVGRFNVIVNGDLNGDGEIQVNDVLSILRAILQMDEISELQESAGDVNSDGLNTADALTILRYILGLEDKLE